MSQFWNWLHIVWPPGYTKEWRTTEKFSVCTFLNSLCGLYLKRYTTMIGLSIVTPLLYSQWESHFGYRPIMAQRRLMKALPSPCQWHWWSCLAALSTRKRSRRVYAISPSSSLQTPVPHGWYKYSSSVWRLSNEALQSNCFERPLMHYRPAPNFRRGWLQRKMTTNGPVPVV